MSAFLVFLAQTLTGAAPLVFAALAGVLSERSGVATIALEGYLLAGAFAAVAVALGTHSTVLALLVAAVTGAAMGALFAACAVRLRAHAIVSGVAVNLFAAAATRVALTLLYDSASNSPSLPVTAHRGASAGLLALRDALTQPLVWLCPVAVWAVHTLLAETVLGLRISAVGEHPVAASTVGISVPRVRTAALTLGGVLGALGGAQLGLHQGQFLAYMSGGRGFLALAAVILGRWQPQRAAVWALGLGALGALEASLEGVVPVPSAVLQAMPFALTLLAVSGRLGRARAPAALG